MSMYVTTRQYKGVALCGEYIVIHYGDVLEERDGTLHKDGMAICLVNSDNGQMHFSWDDDGRGRERGALTYAMAYGDNGKSYAFSDAENTVLRFKWGRYLRRLSDTNIVNADFFKAPIDVLEEIASDLHFVRRKNRYYYSGTGCQENTGGSAHVRGNIGWNSGGPQGCPGLHNVEIA